MTVVGSKIEAGLPGQGGEVAIIGMACIFPGAANLDAYWHNIVSGVDAITDVPPGRWDPEVFFDPNASSPGRVYCKRGGYLDDLARCNPLEYGIMPILMEAGEPDQILSLRVAHEALADAGYATRPFDRERTEIILGRGNYSSRAFHTVTLHTLGIEETLQVVQSLYPEHSAEELEALRRELRANLPPFNPDTAGTLIPNLTTGRVANRLDLMGANFTVDAACASALIALDLAVRDLQTGRCDLALVGGVHLATHVPFLAVFSQLGALSRSSQIRPFDEKADGLVPGEGVGIVVLKRGGEAERDGDRIYATIKGVGISSDGRGQALLAPRVEGEELAVRRAYGMAGVAPDTIELIEAHGTGTPVGDLAEMQALTRVFGPRRGPLPTCAIGSVKSMIGHLMPAAGIAGLIKAVLALYHKVLPPTLHCERPNPKFELEKTPFYVNTEPRPWVHGDETPRRAAVSSFGFGGINAHVVLEERPAAVAEAEPVGSLCWETELCLLQGDSRQELIEQGRRLERFLAGGPEIELKDLAYTLSSDLRDGTVRLALIASSTDDLRLKLARALSRLEDAGCRQMKDTSGVYFFEEPLLARGKLAFLFPGEASQYPNMLKDLCLHFPEIRAAFDLADRIFLKEGRPLRPSQSVFPPPGVSEEARAGLERRLWEIGGALESILAANWALYGLLQRLGIRADVLLGHSSGEFSALAAAGILTPDATFLDRVVDSNSAYDRLVASGRLPAAALAAVGADRAAVAPLLQHHDGEAFLAMDNCPHQVVIVGREHAVEDVLDQLRAQGVVCQRLPFARAYHTPPFRTAMQPLEVLLREAVISPPQTEIYCAATSSPYPRTPQEIRDLIIELWSRPVEFKRTVEALYEAGVRVFVEVGPKGNLTAFVDDILRGSPHLAVPCDVPRRSGITQLNHVVGLLAAQGAGMRLSALYERRSPQRLALDGTSTAGNGSRRTQDFQVPLAAPMVWLAPRGADTLSSRARPPVPFTPTARVASSPDEPLRHAMDGAASSAPVAEAVASPASAVIAEHFRTMESFLAVEQEIMEAFLGVVDMPAAAPPLAFAGTVVSLTPGQEVVVRRRFDPDEDVWLWDHSFADRVSAVDPALKPLPVVALTVCVETMAEAAALLAPGQVLVGMRDIQARQWIEVGGPIILEVTARRQASAEPVTIEIRNLGAADGPYPPNATPVVEGTALFADAYPEPPGIMPLTLESERPCRHTAERMYEERLMFHGPRFQGVASLDRSGEDGLKGHLRVLPRTDLFASTAAPHFLTDPVLLDNAGQLLGYWAAERLSSGYTVFPFRLGALDIYGPSPEVSELVRCEVKILEVTSRRLRAALSLFGADGRLRLRLSDWEDWRFFWPREFYDFTRFPNRYLLTTAWEVPVSRLPRREAFVCQRFESTPETSQTIVTQLMPCLVLSGSERRQWDAMAGPEKRRNEWVLGRAVAKDAVRRLLRAKHRVDLYPADIEIDHDQDGRPFARVLGTGEPMAMPAISIAHSDGHAVALAGHCADGHRLGIDLERIRPRADSFLTIAFSEAELTILQSVAGSERDEWVTRLWCAKEAVAKALGKGLVDGPRSLAVRSLDAPTGRVTLVLGAGLARRVPEFAGAGLVAYTAREGDWVVATSLCDRS